MNKDTLKKLINNYYIQLLAVFFIALILILVSIVLFEDANLDNRILIYNIFGTLTLIGFLYSYSLTKKNLRNDLSFGFTRKESYSHYLRNSFISLLVAQFLVFYYMIIYKIVINVNKTIFEIFDLREIIFLPLIFLTLSFFGFFLGLFQVRKRFFYMIFSTIVSALVVLILYFTIAYFLNLILLGFVIFLGVINYILILKYNI